MLNEKEMVVRFLPFGGSNHCLVQLEVQSIGTPGTELLELRISGSPT